MLYKGGGIIQVPSTDLRLHLTSITTYRPTMSSPPFESRIGTWEFNAPSGAMGYSGQVVRWANITRLPLYFNYSKVGPDHSLVWIAAPIREYHHCYPLSKTNCWPSFQVDGEELAPEFFGYSTSKAKAKEEACRKMALSGHCVR